jgi:hypothetical protein
MEDVLDVLLVSILEGTADLSFDHYLSLGFGRPQSNFADFSEDEVFLQLAQQRQGSPELASDVYIASQVQLSKVCLPACSLYHLCTDTYRLPEISSTALLFCPKPDNSPAPLRSRWTRSHRCCAT